MSQPVASDTEYLMVMMMKLVDALLRKGTYQGGDWGYPSFRDELREMHASLLATDALQKYPKTTIGGRCEL